MLPPTVDTSPWTYAREGGFYLKLIALDDDAYRMTFEEDVRFSGTDVTNSDDATRSVVYEVESTSGILARGYAKMSFVRSAGDNRWLITIWEERNLEPADNAALTFTFLRLNP
jgi:hypothetical protein